MSEKGEQDHEELSIGERVAAYPVVLGKALSHVAHLVAMHVGLLNRGDLGAVAPRAPETPWEIAATEASAPLSEVFRKHSMRTWYFAKVLSERDGVRLDPQQLYVSAILHDLGLFAPRVGRCFTAAGAAAARLTAPDSEVATDQANAVAAAISSHIDLRVPPTPLGKYLQAGSLLDVVGTRVWNVHPLTVDAVYARWPGDGYSRELSVCWKAECTRFPQGRAAFAPVRFGLPIAARRAPLPRT